jgi:hypothetical protein
MGTNLTLQRVPTGGAREKSPSLTSLRSLKIAILSETLENDCEIENRERKRERAVYTWLKRAVTTRDHGERGW